MMAIEKPMTVSIPADLAAAIERLAGSQPEAFVLETLRNELRRRDQLAAIREASGAWKAHDDIPDTVDGLVEFMRRLRDREERFPQ